jgi:glycosyltransferase involved in cell wall biosynthesis
MERLLHSAELAGHKVSFISTNGYEGMDYWTQQRSEGVARSLASEMAGKPFDIDITYTIPFNFPQRFLKNSKVKIGRFDYESSILPEDFCKNLNHPDYLVASSEFVADVFRRAGADPHRVKIIHSGVDRTLFNESVVPLDFSKLGNPFIFLAVAEPHYRKQLDRLLQIYCDRFTASDNTLLVIKTKLFEPGDKMQGYEQDIKPYLAAMKSKYGTKMPAVKVIGKRVPSLAALYRAAHVTCLPTVGEGWCMPFLESLSCGTPVIAPRYGGQLEFLNDKNALLCPVKMDLALPQEQYGGYPFGGMNWQTALKMPKGLVGRPDEGVFGDLMRHAYMNHSAILSDKSAHMKETAVKFSWDAAAKQMLELAR